MAAIDDLQAELRSTKARWVARQTPQFNLSSAQKAQLLGVVIDSDALANAMTPQVQASDASSLPEVDWRNRNGNHVTPVKDQRSCGTCVSFCTVAVVESMASIKQNVILDLSEADLHFCSEHGATCDGWWPDNAYNSLITRGATDEADFPYSAAFQGGGPKCITPPDRNSRVVKITNSTTLANIADRKNWLSNNGPCSAVFAIYNDFYAYGGGVYHHVSGNIVGYHCAEVIGYSESEQCWICKNSWGTSWGDRGFFKIGYGEAGIDTTFPFWTATGVILPTHPQPHPQPSQTENLGGICISAPAASSWAANRLDAFVIGTDRALYHKSWTGSDWSNWEGLGGICTSAPAAVSWGSNHIDTFVIGTDNAVYHKSWNGSAWSNWEGLGGNSKYGVAVASQGANQLDCFAINSNGALYHKSWNGSVWSNWENLGGICIAAPAAVSWGVNRVDVFVIGTDNAVYHKLWNGSTWSNWESLGGNCKDGVAVASKDPNQLDCYAIGFNNDLIHTSWNGSVWSGWASLGGNWLQAPAAVSLAGKRIDTFLIGTDKALYHQWFS